MAYLMIVDDDEDFANAAAKILQDSGHEVSVELTTQGAMQSMEQRQPDLVILDVMFPENSSAGFELARSMRSHSEKLKSTTLLMLTAINAEMTFKCGTEASGEQWPSVTDLLEKPVDFDVLCNRVSTLLHNRSQPLKNGGK